jgi:hypothetical protein
MGYSTSDARTMHVAMRRLSRSVQQVVHAAHRWHANEKALKALGHTRDCATDAEDPCWTAGAYGTFRGPRGEKSCAPCEQNLADYRERRRLLQRRNTCKRTMVAAVERYLAAVHESATTEMAARGHGYPT